MLRNKVWKGMGGRAGGGEVKRTGHVLEEGWRGRWGWGGAESKLQLSD